MCTPQLENLLVKLALLSAVTTAGYRPHGRHNFVKLALVLSLALSTLPQLLIFLCQLLLQHGCIFLQSLVVLSELPLTKVALHAHIWLLHKALLQPCQLER